MESIENVEMHCAADLQVPVDADMSYAAEADEAEQQAPGHVAGAGMEPHGAEARIRMWPAQGAGGCPMVMWLLELASATSMPSGTA